MDKDKAIRAAKLTLGGILEKRRAAEAKDRAGGQIAPSKYLPGVPRAVHADGGPAGMGDNGGPPLSEPPIDLGQAREQKQLRTFHSGMMDDIQTRASHAMEAHQKAVDAGVFDGYEIGDVLQGSAHPMRITAKFMRKWKPTPMTLQGFDRMGAKPTIIEHEGKQYIPMLRYQTGVEGQDGFQEGDAYLDRVKAAGYKKMGGLRAVKADGGSVSDPRAAFLAGNHPAVPDVVYHGAAPSEEYNVKHLGSGVFQRDLDEEKTQKNRDAMDFREFRPSSYGNYGPGIYLTDKPDIASQYAMGIRADQKEEKPYGQVMKLHVSMKQPFTDSALRHPAWRDYIRKALTQHYIPHDEDRNARDAFLKKLDDGTATVRDMFLRETPRGTLVNQWGNDEVHDTIRRSGFDGIIAHRPDGSKEIVAFKPEQVKSAISARKFDPTSPDMTFAAGGAAMFEGIHPDLQDEQGNPMELWHGTPGEGFEAFDDKKLGSTRDYGFYGRGHYLTPDAEGAAEYAGSHSEEGTLMGPLHAALKNPYIWDTSSDNASHRTLRDLQSMGIMKEKSQLDPWDNLQRHHIDPFMREMQKRGHDGVIVRTQSYDDRPHQVSEVVVFKPSAIKHKDAEVFDPNDPRIMRASGGRTLTKHGLYSKAAEIIRSLPQEKGTVDQYIAAAKARGAKPAELDHAGRPEGDKITREEMAKHFDSRLPNLKVEQYGENPAYLTRDESKKRIDLQSRHLRGETLTPEEMSQYDALTKRSMSGVNELTYRDDDTGEEGHIEPEYGSYVLPGGQNYRERLLKLQVPKDPRQPLEDRLKKLTQTQNAWPEGHPARDRFDDEIKELNDKLDAMPPRQGAQQYQSSHWAGHPNVLAHIRMQDRMVGEDREAIRPIMDRLAQMVSSKQDRPVSVRDLSSGSIHTGLAAGVITPEEAASASRLMGWYTGHENKKGIGSSILHVEELQSDWAQDGRESGFNTGQATKAYQDHIKGLRDRFEKKLSWMGDQAAIDKRMDDTPLTEMAHALGEIDNHRELARSAADERGKAPIAPYVQNTQHWTDLALKNVLREAALGNYDGVVFTPGQAQADRYGLEKQLSRLDLRRPEPGKIEGSRLFMYGLDGRQTGEGVNVNDEAHLHQLVGQDVAGRLLASPTTEGYGSTVTHSIRGDDLKMGGEGMKGYYDNIVPKSVMRLAQQHDPDIKPGSMELPQGYTGFSIPMTDKLKQGVLAGQPAFKRGGSVDVEKALAVTRSFTKDGRAAMMRLKD